MRVQRTRRLVGGGALTLALLALALSAGCSASDLLGTRPQAENPPPPAEPPPPPAAPAVDMAGRWRLAAAAGGACFMTFGIVAGVPGAAAAQGTIAPEGGCPDNFFTSRKWTFEDGELIIRDFKGQTLARLSYSGDHFQGEGAGGALTLARPAAR
jgi:hypothetical protein